MHHYRSDLHRRDSVHTRRNSVDRILREGNDKSCRWLLPDPRPQGKHERQTMRDYARTSEALLGVKNLSNEERESIRDSVADVTGKILDADQGQ
jgi:hypothetical protein